MSAAVISSREPRSGFVLERDELLHAQENVVGCGRVCGSARVLVAQATGDLREC